MEHKYELHDIIEELDTAYRSMAGRCGSMNIDYAGFASMALEDFRKVLRNPDLSSEDLQAMLRAGMRAHRIDNNDSKWTKFVASHVQRVANENADL